MRYLSVCSGIEAATCAWHPLGWTPVAFSEVDKFPSAVLAHHYPDVPNWGDMTKFKEWPNADVDVLVGGTPCQSFSVAGLRKGMDDPRGNLALTYLAIAQRYRPQWLVWENVPGVLSSNGGRDFGSILGGMVELGYGVAYRVLDAQHFGVPQRRRRVFVVGYLGDWRRAAAVLFERESLLGDHPPRREAGKGLAPTISARTKGGGGLGTDFDCDGGLIAFGQNNTSGPVEVSHALQAHPGPMGRMDFGSETFLVAPIAFSAKDHGADAGPVAPTLRSGGHHKSHANGGVMPVVAFDTTQITSKANYSNPKPGDPCHPLAAGAHPPAVAFMENVRGELRTSEITDSLKGTGGKPGQGYAAAAGGTFVTEEYAPTLQAANNGSTAVPAICFSAKDHGADAGDISPTLRGGGHHRSHANGGVMPAVAFEWQPGSTQRLDMHENFSPALIKSQTPAVAFAQNQCGEVRAGDVFNTLNTNSNASRRNTPLLQAASAVRRLTPRECCRLQGFPDDYLDIIYRGKPASDGPKYKSLGNSMAVPVMRWIGERIAMVEAIPCESEAA